jgi:sigma-70-like protein
MASTEQPAGAEDVRAAAMRLPRRQREALELRERESSSYGEIASSMELDVGAIAQLIARARINLYDELRGTALASVAAPSPECERALPLIAAREDGQLEAASAEPAWLEAHLAGCERCRLADEQMGEAATAYSVGTLPGTATAAEPGTPGRRGLSRRRATLMGALGALLLLAGVAGAALLDGTRSTPPVEPASASAAKRDELVPGRAAKRAGSGGAERSAAKKQKRDTPIQASAATTAAGEATATSTPTSTPVDSGGGAPSEPAGGRDGSSGKAAVQPTQQTSSPKASPKPKPSPAPTAPSQPATQPPSTTTEAESPPPGEAESEAPGRSDEAPGKATGNPHGSPPGHS